MFAEAVEALRKTITKFTPQGEKAHRSENNKVEYFYNAVIEADRACSALTSWYTNISV